MRRNDNLFGRTLERSVENWARASTDEFSCENSFSHHHPLLPPVWIARRPANTFIREDSSQERPILVSMMQMQQFLLAASAVSTEHVSAHFAAAAPKTSVPTPSFGTTPILRAATKRSFRVARSFHRVARQQKSLPTEGGELSHILKTPAKWEDFCESTGAPLMGGEAVALPTLVAFAEWQLKKGNLAPAKASTSQIKSWGGPAIAAPRSTKRRITLC